VSIIGTSPGAQDGLRRGSGGYGPVRVIRLTQVNFFTMSNVLVR
jgi:hypothetical protein